METETDSRKRPTGVRRPSSQSFKVKEGRTGSCREFVTDYPRSLIYGVRGEKRPPY